MASANSGFTYGVQGWANSPTGRGIYGVAASFTGVSYGVDGQSFSSSGTGVHGEAFAPNGFTFGGDFATNSPDGRGVRGNATATTGLAVGGRFATASTAGIGVWATSNASSGTTYAVLGDNSVNGSGWGLYALGHSGASGVKAFRIDHPDDPENKYLLHYSSESPMPQNFYVGNVVTDSKGYAWVELPDYFSEINANFKYQLTVVDDADSSAFVQAKVSKKIRDGRFQVRTSAPNTEISWRVDADRNDLYVRNRPPKDVMDKEGREKGTYQHPEFYGFKPERGMSYEPERAKRPIKPKAK